MKYFEKFIDSIFISFTFKIRYLISAINKMEPYNKIFQFDNTLFHKEMIKLCCIILVSGLFSVVTIIFEGSDTYSDTAVAFLQKILSYQWMIVVLALLQLTKLLNWTAKFSSNILVESIYELIKATVQSALRFVTAIFVFMVSASIVAGFQNGFLGIKTENVISYIVVFSWAFLIAFIYNTIVASIVIVPIERIN